MVANNLIVDYYRTKDKRPLSLENVSTKSTLVDSTQEKDMDKKLKREIFERHLKELKSCYREIIKYRYLQELNIQEISKLTGRSPNNISVLLHRGIKKIKKNILDSSYIMT